MVYYSVMLLPEALSSYALCQETAARMLPQADRIDTTVEVSTV